MKFILIFLFFSQVFFSELTAMKKACESSIPEACYELAIIYIGKDHLIPDINKSIYYYQLACDLNHNKACNEIEKLYQNRLNL